MSALEWTFILVVGLVALASAGHALLNKRDPRSALGWIAVCLAFPIAGPLLYFLFGINRIRTRARKLHGRSPARAGDVAEAEGSNDEDGSDDSAREARSRARSRGPTPAPVRAAAGQLAGVASISDAVTRWPLVGGNRVELLHNGEQVFPAMLDAIDRARRSVYLATYIFETNATGRRFVDALARAVGRGVDVRVMVDGIGELYSIPRVRTLLSRQGVRFARFLPPKLIPPSLSINLRNHRKIMVTDRCVAFTGGINIGDRHLADELDNEDRVVDVHFRLTGPVVSQIEETFLEDWRFVTGDETPPPPPQQPTDEETLPSPGASDGRSRVPPSEERLAERALEESASASVEPQTGSNNAICRTIVDGPDEDLDKLATIMVGAVSSAARRVQIMTPYFLPPRELIAVLNAAALRGVEVSIILPARNNLPFVGWATQNMLWELLERGVRVYYQPPPFVHTKLFIVDDEYTQIGTANIDARSLRLNFELAVEVYDRPFAKVLATHFEDILGRSREVSLAELDARSLPVKVRDAFVWLFSLYM